ncbi:DUF943 family protein [Pantoea sp. Lu_F5_004]|uniref:DUF943 family protein n=1 Tax=Pantoea sp. Lu_F5_004 TaxID=3443507 RepID=UPI003EBC5442
MHKGHRGFSAVLVKSFPLTDHGKINWWLTESNNIKEKYHIPLSRLLAVKNSRKAI